MVASIVYQPMSPRAISLCVLILKPCIVLAINFWAISNCPRLVAFCCHSSQPYLIAGSATLDHTLADVNGLNAPERTPTCDKLKKIALPLVHIYLIRMVVFKHVSSLMPKWTISRHSSIDLLPIYHDLVAIKARLDDLFSPNTRHFVLVAG